jgi:predicted DsbA family dithiol-disulfide isomerase
MTLPEMNEETINQILIDEGLDVEEIKKMIEEKEIRRGVQDIDSLSQVMGINGVPMLLINAEPFHGRSYTDLQNKINSLK